MKAIPQTLYGTAAEWTAANQVLAEGEIGVETDTGRYKVGDGVTVWSSLEYGAATAAQGNTADTAVQPGDFTNTLNEIDAATDAVQFAKAEDALDTTVGRLLKVGDFGWGATNYRADAADLNATTFNGVHSYTSASLNSPADVILNAFGPYIHIGRASGEAWQIAVDARSGNMLYRSVGALVTTPWRELFHTGNTPIQPNATNLILDSGAKLGIGITDPGTWEVNIAAPDVGTNNFDRTNLLIGSSKSSAVNDEQFEVFWERTPRVSPLGPDNVDFVIRRRVDASDYRGELRFGGDSGITLGTDAIQPIKFKTGSTERLRIDESGNLLVGTTSVPTGTVNGHAFSGGKFHSSRATTNAVKHVYFFNSNGEVGNITTNGTMTSFVTSSDQRLKENITDAASSAAKIDALQVRQFDWKADGNHQEYGLIAQELDPICPDSVSKGETEDDMWGVDYSKLVPLMLKEIQSLRARVAELENK